MGTSEQRTGSRRRIQRSLVNFPQLDILFFCCPWHQLSESLCGWVSEHSLMLLTTLLQSFCLIGLDFLRQCQVFGIEIDLFLPQKVYSLPCVTPASSNSLIRANPLESAGQSLSWKHCNEQLAVFLFFFHFILYWYLMTVSLVVLLCALFKLWKLKP